MPCLNVQFQTKQTPLFASKIFHRSSYPGDQKQKGYS